MEGSIESKGGPFVDRRNLFGYQQYGVRWMLMREFDRESPGGMLCDDVGLGKSVQMLTLMKLHPLRLNLLVAPKATIEQWLGYIEKWLPEAYAVKGGGKDTETRLA